MQRLFPWMIRDNPSYDPNLIGAVSQAKVLAALVEAGKIVLLPYASVLPYDLAIDEQGKMLRVQCKTGRMSNGAIVFSTHRLRAAKRESGWERTKKSYVGAVDFFGVYCPENRRVYLVPIEESSKLYCNLRVMPPLNNQNKKIRWAKDFEVLPLPNLFLEPEDKLIDDNNLGP